MTRKHIGKGRVLAVVTRFSPFKYLMQPLGLKLRLMTLVESSETIYTSCSFEKVDAVGQRK